ncbi:MAG: UDP-4-amino-4,6-dideoxy-N-acetyl-beta-L-altrosamine transaminase [Colwellia sp.]|nr:UDP-4-amino-4,6-dideoxy-N-acetyl-beta-L-altrosamine transaminase [Colwellia sp.]
MIPYGKQDINQQDIDAVIKVLKSDWLTQGPQVPLFEQALADKCQTNYGIAVNSATSALHIANLALGVGEGDIVWTSPITFVATANSALYCGAKVDFVDVDLSSGNMSVSALTKKLQWAKQHNYLPKVVIPVHLAGQSCDMKAIHQLAKEYGFAIIEDASHAVGGHYHNAPVGCGQYSDITVFSFHPVKIITSAEGGMALTNDAELAERMRLFRSHGITSKTDKMTEPSHGPWYYQQIELGFNYRMTDLQAALGLSQLTRLDEFIEKRNALAKHYDEAFANNEISPLTPDNDQLSAYHLYLILLPETDVETHKQAVISLREQGICAHVHYIPVHLQPYYQQFGFKLGDFPNAEQYYQRVISLPLYPNLSSTDQDHIIEQVKKIQVKKS